MISSKTPTDEIDKKLLEASKIGDLASFRKALAQSPGSDAKAEAVWRVVRNAGRSWPDGVADDMIVDLIANKAPLNYRSDITSTPIILAPYSLRLKTIDLMIRNGADVNAREDGDKPVVSIMFIAERAERVDVINLAFDRGFKMNEYERLYLIEEAPNSEIRELFLNPPRGSMVSDAHMNTEVLIKAVDKGYLNYVHSALLAGEDPDTRTEYGTTLLMIAGYNGNKAMFKLLDDANADFNAKSQFEGVLTYVIDGARRAEAEGKEVKEFEEVFKIALERSNRESCYYELHRRLDSRRGDNQNRYRDLYNTERKAMVLILEHIEDLERKTEDELRQKLRKEFNPVPDTHV